MNYSSLESPWWDESNGSYFISLALILTEIWSFKVLIILLFVILDNFLDGTLDGTCPGHVRDIKILAGHVPCTTLIGVSKAVFDHVIYWPGNSKSGYVTQVKIELLF